MHYLESFHHGGILMWALLACSILGLAVIIDRAWAFWKNSLDYEAFFSQLKLHLGSSKKMLPPPFLQCKNAPVVQITESYYEFLRSSPTKRNTALSRIIDNSIQELNNRMNLLKAIAQIAPLLGLLAAVTGLITSLHQVELLGNAALPSDIAGAIWKSLTPMATGLMISIPCLLVYCILGNKISTVATQLSETLSELDNTLAPLTEVPANEGINLNLQECNKS
jgi:biopolymer transport protein ExbB